MTKLTKEQQKQLDILKGNALSGVEQLVVFLQSIKDDMEDYMQDRADEWHETEGATLHTQWDDRIEEKIGDIDLLKESVENINFDDIQGRNYKVKILSLVDVLAQLEEANSNVESWNEEQKELVEKLKSLSSNNK